MRKSTTPQDFEIHVDPSCLSPIEEPDKENDMTTAADRVTSNETIIHHDIPAEPEPEPEKKAGDKLERHHSVIYQKPTAVSVKDVTEETVQEKEVRERQQTRIEAQIKAAAQAVIASVERDHQQLEDPDSSVLSVQTTSTFPDESTELIYSATELSHQSAEMQSEAGGDSSSQHDADIDDDVFSSSNRSSARSSMISGHGNHSSSHSSQSTTSSHKSRNQKILTSPKVGEEAASSHEREEDTMSRISSYTQDFESSTRTPSKVMSRPPFRTPSSVRAMQMSSPTPSIFSSPRSTKRHLPTVSRIGTPTPHQTRTPTRLKPKKDVPLVLLHVTVLPLTWSYSHLMSSPTVPSSLDRIRHSWKLLQEKISETVQDRGILLPHPQDSYELLEERLLEALELPVHPRIKVLKCGHYMGPSAVDITSSDEEDTYYRKGEGSGDRKWCDICRRDVRLEEIGDVDPGERRFRVKFYASNGLMSNGAWLAAWKEMERVDVEIEPFVDSHLHSELEHLSAISGQDGHHEEHDDGFVDEEEQPTHHIPETRAEEEKRLKEEAKRRARAAEKEEWMQRLASEENMRRRQEEEEAARLHEEEMRRQEELRQEEEIRRVVEAEEELRQRMEEEEDLRRRMVEEERMREIYGQTDSTPRRPGSGMSRRTSIRTNSINEESLQDLLVAAFKVAMRDKKNLVICVLSVVVLMLAVRSGGGMGGGLKMPDQVVMDDVSVMQVVETVEKDVPVVTTTAVVTLTETVVAPLETMVEVQASSVESLEVLETEAPVAERDGQTESTEEHDGAVETSIEVEEQPEATPSPIPDLVEETQPSETEQPVEESSIPAEAEVEEPNPEGETTISDAESVSESITFEQSSTRTLEEETPLSTEDVVLPSAAPDLEVELESQSEGPVDLSEEPQNEEDGVVVKEQEKEKDEL